MFRRNKTAIALLGGFIWLFLPKMVAAVPFSAMEHLEIPIRAAGEFVGFPSFVIPDRPFLRSPPVLPAIARTASVSDSDADLSVVRGDGSDRPNKTIFSTNLSEKPLMGSVMGAEVGMACANPSAGSGARRPATFTWMAVGFAGMIVGRFRMGRL